MNREHPEAENFGDSADRGADVTALPQEQAIPRSAWQIRMLRLAAIHCAVWGVFVILMPVNSARVYGFGKPLTDHFLWQGTGLILFLFGFAYAIASTDPLRHWAVVAMGLAAKVLGPIGMCWAVINGDVSWRVLILIPLNDVVWWYPFWQIVRAGAFHSVRHWERRSR